MDENPIPDQQTPEEAPNAPPASAPLSQQLATAPATPSDGSKEMNLEVLMDLPLQATVELGRSRMTVQQLLELEQGSVVELDRTAGEAVDLYVNERLVARGEVVVVDDNFGLRITELVNSKNGKAGG